MVTEVFMTVDKERKVQWLPMTNDCTKEFTDGDSPPRALKHQLKAWSRN